MYGGHTAISNLDFAQQWTLDPTGNWSRFKEADATSSTFPGWALNQTRTANPVDEITGITGSGLGRAAVLSGWRHDRHAAARRADQRLRRLESAR